MCNISIIVLCGIGADEKFVGSFVAKNVERVDTKIKKKTNREEKLLRGQRVMVVETVLLCG